MQVGSLLLNVIRFMATYNTTYPFEPLSVGPVIHLGMLKPNSGHWP